MGAVRKSVWGAGGVVAVAGLLWWLWPAPRSVDLATVTQGPLQVTVDDVGETRSHDRFVVSAPIAGRVARIDLHEGDAVRADQVLARIAPLPLSQREADEVNGRVAAAEALQRAAQQQAQRAQALWEQARREQQRLTKLGDSGLVSRQAAEQAIAAETAAQADLEAARAQQRAAAADVKVARAALPALQAGRGAAPVLVLAPHAARILRITDASERVVAAGAPLLVLGDVDHLEAVIEVLSSEAVRIRAGMPVLLEGWGGNAPLRAVVRRVEPYAFTKVSALGVEEKRVNVVVDFVDSPGAVGDGFRVTGRIVVWQSPQVLAVPVSALLRCADQWCVWAVQQDRVVQRIVQLGQRNLELAQVLSGLAAGDQVIRYPGSDLVEGQRVRPQR